MSGAYLERYPRRVAEKSFSLTAIVTTNTTQRPEI